MFWYWAGGRLVTGLLSIALVLYLVADYEQKSIWPYVSDLAAIGLLSLLPIVAITWLLLETLTSFIARRIEGEWPARTVISARLRAFAIRRHLRRYHGLRARVERLADMLSEEAPRESGEVEIEMLRSSARELLLSYPPSDHLAPTRLGNTFRASEERLSSRYGMEVLVVLPRLLPILPSKIERRINTKSSSIDFWVRMSVVLALALGLLYLVFFTGALSVLTVLFSTAVLVAGSLASYRVSIASAQSYGVEVEVAFDLHRVQLLEAMNMPVPSDLEHQRELFGLLSRMLSGAALHEIRFIYKERDDEQAKEERLQINNYSVGQAMSVGNRAKARANTVKFASKNTGGLRRQRRKVSGQR